MSTLRLIVIPAILTVLAAAFCPVAQAVEPVAKISRYSGQAYVLSGQSLAPVTRVGQVLSAGDLIQTQQGTVQVIFSDGAVMKVSSHSCARIQEREEESGWMFKTKVAIRRLTCFAGKFWFKSGSSKRKNYLQTPTAVMGIRGSDGDVGYNPQNRQSYLVMYTGEASVRGNVINSPFGGIGPREALLSPVYRAADEAYRVHLIAVRTGRPLQRAHAGLAALQVARQSADVCTDSPDSNVRVLDGFNAQAAADARVAAAEALVVVEELRAALAGAEADAAAARAAGSTEAFNRIQDAISRLVSATVSAEGLQRDAAAAAQTAEAAAAAGNLDAARQAAGLARQRADETRQIGDAIRREAGQYFPPPATGPGASTTETAPPAAAVQPAVAPTVEVTTTTTTSTTTTTTIRDASPAQ